MMDLKALICFWATAKHGSLTRPSIEIGILEPSISLQCLKSCHQRRRLFIEYHLRQGPSP